MELDPIFDLVAARSDDWPGEYSGNRTESSLRLNFVTRHPVLSYSYVVIVGVLSVLGNVGNLMVIGAIFLYKPLKTTGNMFIANLAIADLCVTGIVDPFIIVGVLYGPQFFLDKVGLCHALASVCMVSCTGSLWNLTAVAFNRYIFLCKNHAYQNLYSWNKTFLYCLIVWIVCCGFELPNWIGWGGHTFDLKNMYCYYDRLRDISYTYFIVCVGICLPLIAVCVSYAKIFMYVRATRKEIFSISGSGRASVNNARKRQREEFQLAKTFFILCLVFVLCLSPYALVILIDHGDNWSKIIYVLTVEISHLNNSVNFILYGAMNQRFRDGYKNCLRLVLSCFCLGSIVNKNRNSS